MHDVDPDSELYVPVRHQSHAAAFVENVPGGQDKQNRAPCESAKVPATHGVQDDEPYWEEYEPELHIPQTTSTPPGLK